MSQFDDRLNQIMNSLIRMNEEHGDMEEDNTPGAHDSDPTTKKQKKDKKSDKDKGPKDNPHPWDRGGINEDKSSSKDKPYVYPEHGCGEGMFWCPEDKRCKKNK